MRSLLLGISAVLVILPACTGRNAGPAKPLGEIHYRRDGKLMMVQAKVNGLGPYWFIVDSGAPRTVLDPAFAREIGVTAQSPTSVTGTGQGAVAAAIAVPVRVSLGGTDYRSQPYLIDLSGAPLPKETKGLIGSELFASHVVRIDPRNQRISWYAPDRPPNVHGGADVPLTLTNGRLFLPASIEPRPGVRIQRELRIDTGSESSVNDPSAAQARIIASTILGGGLGSDFQGVSGKYHRVRIGPYQFRQFWGPGGNPPAIGMELLQRFVMTFDASRRRLHLEPIGRIDAPIPHPPGVVLENPRLN